MHNRHGKRGIPGLLCPDLWQGGVHEVDLDKLRDFGILGIILDIDNTLAHWGGSRISGNVISWIDRAKARGFRMCILSNNLPSRIRDVSERLAIPAVSGGIKPFRWAFRKALSVLGTQPAHTAVVGDQLFTDILGGNLWGMYTILVTPLSCREFITTRIVRLLERATLRWLVSRGFVAREAFQARETRRVARGEEI